MTETDFDRYITTTREKFGRDGHLIENIASLIALEAALVRDLFDNPHDASYKLIEAFDGKKNEIPTEKVHRLRLLRLVLGDQREISEVALMTGLSSSDEERGVLIKLSGEGNISVLRGVALKLKVPNSSGKADLTLGDKIRELPPAQK